MSIAADLIRGHTDTIILAALLQEDSYGYRINRTLCELTDGRFELKEATLYTAFKRLEEAGYIHSYWGDEATGARRRYYAITPDGRTAYDRLMQEWQEASSMIEKLIRFGNPDDTSAPDAQRI
jgi:DNA-binding PadR family transcriptional regulator